MPAPDHSSPDPPLTPSRIERVLRVSGRIPKSFSPAQAGSLSSLFHNAGYKKPIPPRKPRRKPSTGIFRAEKELPTLLSNFYDTFMEKYSLFSADGGRQMTFLGGYREGPILRICAGWYKLSHSPLIGAVHSPVRRVTLEIEISASRGSGRGCSHQTPSCSAG